MSSSSESVGILPLKLYLASISRDHFESCIRILLKVTFFIERKTSFFSYTETEDEVSLILDEDSLKTFESIAPNPVSISPGIWKAIQVYEGAAALNETGVISSLCTPLSKENISMIYLSTYNTDLILVKDEESSKALDLLKSAYQQKRQSTPSSTPSHTDTSHKPANTPDTSPTTGSQMLVSLLPNRLAIATFNDLPSFSSSTQALLKEFFFSPPTDRFFSFTASPTEVSMVINEDSLGSFPEKSLLVHSSWRVLDVCASASGFMGSSVNTLSDALAKANISIYYLSTFHTDFILVPENKVDAAIASLKSSLNITLEEK